jgi:hypothetical protein
MGQRVSLFSKLKFFYKNVGVVKASFNKQLVKWTRPETKWSSYEQAENFLISFLRAEPVFVEKNWDDLWLGVKG